MIAMMAAVIVVLVSRVMPIFEQVYIELGSEMTGFAGITFASRQPSEPVFLYFRKYSVHIVVTVPFCYQNPDRQTCHRPVPELVPPHQTFL